VISILYGSQNYTWLPLQHITAHSAAFSSVVKYPIYFLKQSLLKALLDLSKELNKSLISEAFCAFEHVKNCSTGS
jgi:hypothetical protein